MNNTTSPSNVAQGSLEQIRERMDRLEELVVDQQGRLYAPNDPAIAGKPLPEKTVLKPQRWF